MDLWIRSQDRKELLMAKEVYIEKNYKGDNWFIKANYIPELYENSGEYFVLLGTYKSEERALQVLDEIQDHMANIKRLHWYGKNRANTNEAFDESYYMPIK